MATEDEAFIGYGILLQVGDAQEVEAFTTVGYVFDITPPGISAPKIDVSHNTSPDATEEGIPGMIVPGDVTYTLINVPGDATQDNVTGLRMLARTRAIRNWRLIFPEPVELMDAFRGFITNFTPAAPTKDKSTVAVTISVTGLPQLGIAIPAP